MKCLYFETNSGISGDMTVAALLDLGADEKILREGLASLNVGGYTIEISKVKKCGITACDFNVILHDHPHDDAHEHTHSHHHEHEHTHEDAHEHGHTHHREHEHHEHSHHHEHRGINEITAIIDSSEITGSAKTLAKKIFGIVAEAESKVHGLPVNEVHFHEVGAVDSIVDIVGAAICLDNLGITDVFCTSLSEGQGTVWCQHGRVPVPAPATLEIAVSHKIPLVITENQGEMVTPTGAAIVAAITRSFDAPKGFTVLKTGYGAGKKDFALANVLRASIIEIADKPESGDGDSVLELSCNLDDMTGEQIAYACEILLENGALDCRLTPVTMKKGRPATVISILIKPCDEALFTRLLFLHTSTIGVRIASHRRVKMSRRTNQIATQYGNLDIKECSYGDICKTTVEYESAKKLAQSHDIPISEVYCEAERFHK